MKLFRIEHHGPGPVVAIVQAETSGEAVKLFRDHLEGYEGCYRDTGSQDVSLYEPDEPGIICSVLRPF